MRVTHAFVALLATAGVGAQGQAAELDTRDTQRYPVYPEHYDDSYCCMTIVPYTNKCRKGRCEYAPGWRCFFGTGKVNSIRQCEVEVGGDTDAYCKRPGYEYFASPIQWGDWRFYPVLEPSDYRSWLKPGMHEPWVPSQDEIQWEEKSAEANASQDETDPAELRDCDVGDSDMA